MVSRGRNVRETASALFVVYLVFIDYLIPYTEFTRYPLAPIIEKVYLFLRDWVIWLTDTQKVSKVNGGKASVYSTGPINEDEIASMCPYSPNTYIYKNFLRLTDLRNVLLYIKLTTIRRTTNA